MKGCFSGGILLINLSANQQADDIHSAAPHRSPCRHQQSSAYNGNDTIINLDVGTER
jgi:hypothetical protein